MQIVLKDFKEFFSFCSRSNSLSIKLLICQDVNNCMSDKAIMHSASFYNRHKLIIKI